MIKSNEPEHIIDWEHVHQESGAIGPKGLYDAYIFLGTMPGFFIVINGKGAPIFPLVFYPKKIIPVYGF